MEGFENIDALIRNIYIVILAYFLLGGIGFYMINRNKSHREARKSNTKFLMYFLIINILFFSMVIRPVVFSWLTVLIILSGFTELIRLFIRSGYRHSEFFIAALIIFLIISAGFYYYSILSYRIILFTFLITSIFDSFSQITGQLWGKKKIMSRISPNKTVGGVVGGAVIAVISGFILGNLYDMDWTSRIMLIVGIVIFAFTGDALASLYKRKFQVKDFSRFIPGHGGFLDRFDSLIASGAWVAIFMQILQ